MTRRRVLQQTGLGLVGLAALELRGASAPAAKLYAGVPGRTQDVIIHFVTVTAGVSGRF